MVINTINEEMSFCDYYSQWVDVYKEGAIREVTMKKYKLTQAWLRKLIPDLKLSEFDRVSYQKLINGYAEHHEHQTTMDFHHQLKGAILDAVDEGLIQRDPTRKAIIKGKQPRQKKTKYLKAFRCLVWVSGSGGGGAGRVVWGYGYHVVVHRRPATA